MPDDDQIPDPDRSIRDFLAGRGITPESVQGPYRPPPLDRVEFFTTQAAFALLRVPKQFGDAVPDNPDVAGWVSVFLADPDAMPQPAILLRGPTGTGKSRQLWGALRAILESRAADGRGVRWKYTSHPELNESVRGGFDAGQPDILAECKAAHFLMLDDLAAGKHNDWNGDVLYRLIEHRWVHGLPSMYATNLPQRDWAKVLGDRVASRLNDAHQVLMAGDDRRLARRTGA